MSYALLLLPDFLLIVVGFLVCRFTALDRPVWNAAERLVYWLLFPVLLFTAIVRSPLNPAASLGLGLGGWAVVGAGFALATALRRLPGVDPRLQASGAQVSFRFNSYVALALAERIGGSEGVAAIALLVALCVPLCNLGAVWSLARHGGQNTLRELLHNPLILATVAGLVANLAGLRLPAPVDTVLGRIGAAALPLGLMAVGAGLELGGLQKAPRLATALLGIRHLLLPLIGLGLGALLALPSGQAQILVAFAALPTASSCYVLAARMGGDGPYVAGLVTASTLLGMWSVPAALSLFAALR
ncbi:MAG: AEC family transporter [Burkholderiales bacterium]|nr:AEC family transporter [Burkholderiales bacterium]MBP7520153.1 AEC family transporter [Leptothrix sp. (in: b-proteobacteria)]HQY08795.1 AEC family transporter [Burkholderiaceae bacterium]